MRLKDLNEAELVHRMDDQGDESWYNSDGNCVHFKKRDGYEAWFDFDDEGKLIHMKTNDGREAWYDKNGKVITKGKFELK